MKDEMLLLAAAFARAGAAPGYLYTEQGKGRRVGGRGRPRWGLVGGWGWVGGSPVSSVVVGLGGLSLVS